MPQQGYQIPVRQPHMSHSFMDYGHMESMNLNQRNLSKRSRDMNRQNRQNLPEPLNLNFVPQNTSLSPM